MRLEKLKSELINKDNEFEQHKTDTTKGIEHRKKQFTRRLQEEVEAHEITRRRSEVLKEQLEARVSEMEVKIIRDSNDSVCFCLQEISIEFKRSRLGVV